MQRVKIMVVRHADLAPGDAFEVFGGGSGPINYERPLTRRPVALWPRDDALAGHAAGRHLTGRHLAAPAPDVRFDGTHLLDTHLRPARAVLFEAGPYATGRYRHAVRLRDAAGNPRGQPPTEIETVINTAPDPPETLVPVAFDAGRMEFRIVLRAED